MSNSRDSPRSCSSTPRARAFRSTTKRQKKCQNTRYGKQKKENSTSEINRNLSGSESSFTETSPMEPKIDHYKEMTQWHSSHQLAYWQHRALQLETENQGLHQQIRQTYNQQSTPKCNVSHVSTSTETEPDEPGSSSPSPDIQFEGLDPTWLDFMETSEKHRVELRRQRGEDGDITIEKNSSNTSRSVYDKDGCKLEVSQTHVVSEKEKMKELYGEGAAKITACETAIQYTFERHVRGKNTPFWPNIPFNL